MNEMALERARLRFEMFDADKDGYLQATDFEAFAQRLIRVAGVAESSPKAQSVIDGHRQFFQALARSVDENKDNKVSLLEYQRLVHTPGWFDDNIKFYAESIAALGDKDNDGYIEKPDFVALLQAMSFKPENAESFFDAMDIDRDGRLSFHEWMQGIRAYYTDVDSAVADTLVSK